MSVEALSGKVFLLVTDASHGIGRQIAIIFGSLLQEGSHILLLAKNLTDLQEVAKEIPFKVTVDTVSMDLNRKSNKVELEETISRSLKETTPDSFDRVVLVYNVRLLNDIARFARELRRLYDWDRNYWLNWSIPAILTEIAMNMFNSTNIKKVLICVASWSDLEAPNKCRSDLLELEILSQGGAFFRSFALKNPDVDVLSYTPGPVETDMFKVKVCENLVDSEAKMELNEMRTTKTVLTPKQTILHLVQVLQKHKYKSGDHVDYYDKL